MYIISSGKLLASSSTLLSEVIFTAIPKVCRFYILIMSNCPQPSRLYHFESQQQCKVGLLPILEFIHVASFPYTYYEVRFIQRISYLGAAGAEGYEERAREGN